MRAAVYRVDVVRKGIDLFVIAVVVLDGDLDREILALLFKVDRLVVQRRFVLVQVLDEFRNSAFVIELVRPLRLLTLVFDRDPDPFVQKCFSRNRSESLSKLNAVSVKICVSGLKVTFVPRFRVFPVCLSGAMGIPRAYSCS